MFLVCTGMKMQIFNQKNNIYMLVVQNIGYFCKKLELLEWQHWNFSQMQMKSHPKKDQKAIFLSVEQFMVKTQFEISKYLPQYLWAQIFAGAVLEELFNSSPNFGGLRGKVKRKHHYMWSFVYPIDSSHKYVKKVKLNPNYNPNIFSEIIELQENGVSGDIQAQIPNCTVYIGIAA